MVVWPGSDVIHWHPWCTVVLYFKPCFWSKFCAALPDSFWSLNILQSWLWVRVQIPAEALFLCVWFSFSAACHRCCPHSDDSWLPDATSHHSLGAPRFPRHQPQKPSSLASNTVEANMSTTNRQVLVDLSPQFWGPSSFICCPWAPLPVRSETGVHQLLSWWHSLQDYLNIDCSVSLLGLSS